MKIPVLLLCLVVPIAAFGYVHNPNKPIVFSPADNQSIFARQQALQGVRAPVGKQEIASTPVIPLPVPDSKAASVVASSISHLARDGVPTGPVAAITETSVKAPMTAILVGLAAFGAFWLAGKRQGK